MFARPDRRPHVGPIGRAGRVALSCLAGAVLSSGHAAETPDPTEYRVKAAFLYNFALFTVWPTDTGRTLNLCIEGTDPFGAEIDPLQGKPIGDRVIAIQRLSHGDTFAGCQIVYIAPTAIGRLPRIIERLGSTGTLTVADSPGAAQQGVALNMAVSHNKVTFEANLAAARAAGLGLSSKLLRLATEVIQ